MAQANPIENPAGGDQPPEWFLRWLTERETTPKTPQLIKIEEDLGSLNISESVKSKIRNEVLLQTTVEDRRRRSGTSSIV